MTWSAPAGRHFLARDQVARPLALLLYDGSRPAEAALEYVVVRHRQAPVRVYVLNVSEVTHIAAMVGSPCGLLHEVEASETAKSLAGARERLVAHGIEVTTASVRGWAIDVVPAVATRVAATYVVVGESPPTVWQRWFGRSVSERLRSRCACQVVGVYPAGERRGPDLGAVGPASPRTRVAPK
jgi:nucleotide-binding universal stress UspA family protein